MSDIIDRQVDPYFRNRAIWTTWKSIFPFDFNRRYWTSIDTLFNYRNLAVDIKWFSHHMVWRLTCAVWRLHFTTKRLDKLTAVHSKRRTSTRTSSDGCSKLFPISDNVSVVIQDVLVQHFRFLYKSWARRFHGWWFWFYYKRISWGLAVCRKRQS